MVVDVLTEVAPSGHDDRLEARGAGLHDRSGPAGADDRRRVAQELTEPLGGEERDGLDGSLDRPRVAVLHDEPRLGVARAPGVDPVHEPPEPVMVGPDRHEDERADGCGGHGQYTGPAVTVSRYSDSCSGHWTRKRSVTGRQSRPVIVAESMRS